MRRSSSRVAACAIAVFAALCFFAGGAHAQTISDLPRGADSRLGVGEGLEQRQPYWAATNPRPFLSAEFELGTFALKPELGIGYGKPHYAWGGLSTWSRVGTSGVGFFAGPKFQIPHFGFSTGARFESSVNQRFLERREVYDREAIDSERLSRSHFVAWDSELYVDGKAPGGTASLLVTLHAFFGVPQDNFIFEDSLHIVIDPPFAWRTRFAYVFNVGDFDSMGIGFVAELLGSPGRDLLTGRVGPVISVALTHHLTATAVAAFEVAGRDETGLAGADLGQIGLRYTWATGDRWAEFP